MTKRIVAMMSIPAENPFRNGDYANGQLIVVASPRLWPKPEEIQY